LIGLQGLTYDVRFGGQQFVPTTEVTQVYLGNTQDRYKYPCAFSLAPGSSQTELQVTLPVVNSVESNLFFTVVVGGQVTTLPTSYDKVAFTSDVVVSPPSILNISGCDVQMGSMTASCPTAGGIPITVFGGNLSGASVSLNGISVSAGDVLLNTENEVQFTLPPSAGFNSVVEISTAEGSTTSSLLSYAAALIIAVEGCEPESTLSLTRCPRQGPSASRLIRLLGSNFGASGARVLVGAQTCAEVAHDAGNPHGNLTCTLAEVGDKIGPVRNKKHEEEEAEQEREGERL